MTVVFVPKEPRPGELRVAGVPATVKALAQKGLTVLVERGAGERAFYPDSEYQQAGAELVERQEGLAAAEAVLCLHPLGAGDGGHLKPGATTVSFLLPGKDEATVAALAARGCSAFSLNYIPRISRAQRIDALSSQNNIAGYKAVLLAAEHCPKIFPLLMTAAGTLRPVRVVILGAGVAGLQAVATARRLGAVVEVSDVRHAVKEQVESLGARFIEAPGGEDLTGEGGYAREASAEYLQRQAEVTAGHVKAADVVISTALVPNRPAPRLISAATVSEMRPGSVIVDLAAEQGGNCEVTKPGATVQVGGVTVVGPIELASTVPFHASAVYAKNVYNVLTDALDKENRVSWRLDDEIAAAALAIYQGERRNHFMTGSARTGSDGTGGVSPETRLLTPSGDGSGDGDEAPDDASNGMQQGDAQ